VFQPYLNEELDNFTFWPILQHLWRSRPHFLVS